jgi:cytochrome P450
VAGNETTRHLIGNAVRCFLENPGTIERLSGNPDLLPSAIEEVLRFRGPAQMTGRVAMADTQIGSKQIKAGEGVIVLLAAANRDPAEFPDPECFDIAREPNRHIAFGLGPHFCLGAPLARLEARVALHALLNKLARLHRTEEGPFELIDGFVLHGLKRLPVEFERAA